jgi:hypothetical protein
MGLTNLVSLLAGVLWPAIIVGLTIGTLRLNLAPLLALWLVTGGW